MRRPFWILAVLLSHWRRHPMQFATLMIGLASAIALWSGVQALNLQARTSYDRAAAAFGGVRTAALVSRNGVPFSQQLFVELRRAGWPVSPVLEGRIQVGGRTFRLLGIEPVTLPAEVGDTPAIGGDLQAFVMPPGETRVAPETLAELGLSEGASPQTSNDIALPPLRVAAQLAPGVMVVDIGIAQRLLKMPDQVSRLLVGKARGPRATLGIDCWRSAAPDRARCGDRPGAPHRQFSFEPYGVRPAFVFRRAVHRQLGDWARIRATAADVANLARLRRLGAAAQHGIGDRADFLCPRRRIFGDGRRLSDCGRAVARCRRIVARTLWRANSGAALASAAMVDRGPPHQCGRRAPGRDAKPVEGEPPVRARGRPAPGLASGTTAMGGSSSDRRASRCSSPPSDFSGLAIRCLRVLPCWRPCMLGAALALPLMLELVLTGGQRQARGALATWFWADSRQQLSGLSLALMALLLALSVNVGVGTMVESFSRTFIGWLDGRLAADLYLNASDDAQARAITAWLRERRDITAILPGGRADTQFAGAPLEVFGLPDHATYRDRWPLLRSSRNAWARLRGGRCGIHQRTTCRAHEACDRRHDRGADTGWKLEDPGCRHLCRLRQSQSTDRGQLRRADPLLSKYPADANRLARAACGYSRTDVGVAGKIRTG